MHQGINDGLVKNGLLDRHWLDLYYRLKKSDVNSKDLVERKVDFDTKRFFHNMFDFLEFYYYNLPAISGDLEALLLDLYKCKSMWSLVWITGSLGDGTFKLGWSDVDIFLVITENALKYPLKFSLCYNLWMKRIAAIAGFQIHGIFIATDVIYKLLIEKFLPIFTLDRGVILSDEDKVDVVFSKQFIHRSRENYFMNDIVKGLRAVSDGDTLWDRIMFIHRIYSFPFSYLQWKGLDVSKKESFAVFRQYSKEAVEVMEYTYNNMLGTLRKPKALQFVGSVIGYLPLGWYYKARLLYKFRSHITCFKKTIDAVYSELFAKHFLY